MDAFETLVSALLRQQGYWTIPSFKVELTRSDKIRIGRHTSPRWEIDIVAYSGLRNEILAVECKSYLDSRGVQFRNGAFEPADRYKLFSDDLLRRVVFSRTVHQLVKSGACAVKPRIRLALAAGKMASITNKHEMKSHFKRKHWELFDDEWLKRYLLSASESSYENDIAFVVSKLLSRGKREQDVISL